MPAVPAVIIATAFAIGRSPARRRASMVIAMAAAGVLIIATASALGALGEPDSAVWFQVACFAVSVTFVAIGVGPWRRVERDGAAADDLLRMYDEL